MINLDPRQYMTSLDNLSKLDHLNQHNSELTNSPSLSDRRVGVIGGGQLAWMMANAAEQLGVHLIVQTPQVTDPAVTIAQSTVLAAVADAEATGRLAQQAAVITFENEFVNLAALAKLAQQGVCFRPPLTALEPLLDKYIQRCFFRDHQLPTPDFISPVPTTLPALPTVLKTRRMGYDGQGTFIVKAADEYSAIVDRIGAEHLLMEAFVPFERELAVMAARSAQGEMVIYPIVETEQQNQVCRWVIAPAIVTAQVQQQIAAIARTILTELNFVGILGIELFLTGDDRVFVNEVAPRTHNSGHYTLDAAVTSQFEQQLRAVCDLPLGDPAMNCTAAVMVNLLGFETATRDYAEQRQQLATIPQAYVHWYGKSESRPGRKLGHVTVKYDGDPGLFKPWAMAQVQAIETIWSQ
jgi:5-(carboxyamino)imidazole ribonucleotide synthase